ncbi:MAG: DEAD/DEAH box helicase family protein, partial [Gammaproteobacteria bacterium]|nr:DEAD/DEAH box helicase family protein [Gammaproteobacteria bacterium]
MSQPSFAVIGLRPYQQQAVHDVYDQVESGTRRVLLVAATGAGKTSLAGHITSDAVS